MGRRDPPEEGCALKPNKSTIGDNDGHGIDCGSLSTVDGLLDDLNGALGATSLNDLNEDCPDCCFTNLGLPPEMQASRRGSMPPATGYALRRDGAIADALRPFVALDQKEPRPFPHYWNETTRSDRVRAKPLDGVNPRISLPT